MTGIKSASKCLFGGALLSAGLTVGSASAQQFQLGYTAAHLAVYEFGSFNSDYQSHFTYGDVNLSVAVSGDSAYANGTLVMNASGMSAKATAGSFGAYAYSHDHDLITYFTVDQNFNATVDWDFTQANSSYTNYLTIIDADNNLTVFDHDSDAGTTQVSFTAGTNYVMFALSDVTAANFGEVGTSRWSITVPAPGSAGLLGLAGVIAARRRRTAPRTE